MKLRELRQMTKGLSGDLDCEFLISYDSGYARARSKELAMRVEREVKDGKTIQTVIFEGADY